MLKIEEKKISKPVLIPFEEEKKAPNKLPDVRDFGLPMPKPDPPKLVDEKTIEENVLKLVEMGFEREKARETLKATNGNAELAIEILGVFYYEFYEKYLYYKIGPSQCRG